MYDFQQTMILTIKVTARTKKTKFVGKMANGTLKIHLKAVPEKGRANEALIEFLSDFLHIQKNQIEIVQGHTSPRKLIHIPDSVELPF